MAPSCAADFAQRLIVQARTLHAGDSTLGPLLGQTVFALDATTIDLCLSVFPWAHFRITKGAVKMHTLLDLSGGFRSRSGSIPSFIHSAFNRTLLMKCHDPPFSPVPIHRDGRAVSLCSQ